jgi:hypothetical protein
MQRWHTLGPADEDITVRDKEPVIRSLPDLLRQSNAASNVPLYKILTETDLKTTFEATDDEVKWLKDSVKPAFDHYVGNVLRINRYEPWNDEHQIRNEYAKEDAWRLPLYTVMARMLTYAEIEEQIVRATKVEGDRCASRSLWKPPSPRKRSAMNEHWKRRFLTDADTHQIWSIEPEELRGSRLDPRHRWGVVATSWPLENSPWSHPIRMACCGEYLGQSDGCWIMLDKGAQTYGEILEYTAFLGLVDWSAVVVDDGKLITWKTAPFQRGTAWQDLDYYKKLDEQIQTVITGLKTNMPTAFTAYIDKLQNTVDAAADESTPLALDLDAYSTMITKAPGLTQLVTLLNAFNAIQLRTPVLDPKEYVNRRIIKTHEMPTYWTYEARAGLQLTNGRLKALPRDRPALRAELDTFITDIGAEPPGKIGLDAMKTIAQRIQKAASNREQNMALYAEIERIRDLIARENFGTRFDVEQKPGLDALTARDNIATEMKRRQNAANDIMRNMRGVAILSAEPTITDAELDIADPQPPDKTELKALNASVRVAIVVRNAGTTLSASAVPGIADKMYNLYTQITSITAVPDPIILSAVSNDKDIIAAIQTQKDTVRELEKTAASILEKLRSIQGKYNYVQSITTLSNKLKQRVLVDLKLDQEIVAETQKVTDFLREHKALPTITQKIIDDRTKVLRLEADKAIAPLKVLLGQTQDAITIITKSDAKEIAEELETQKAALKTYVDSFKQVESAKALVLQLQGKINNIVMPNAALLATSVATGKTSKEYLTKWNQDVIDAAAALLGELKQLLTFLENDVFVTINGTDASQKADALVKAAEEAFGILEDPKVRAKKQADELARRRKLIAPEFNQWINTSELAVKGSSVGLKGLKALWEDLQVQIDVSSKKNELQKAGLIIGNNLPVRIYTTSTLNGAIENWTTIKPGSAFSNVSADKDILAVWDAFKEYLVTAGLDGATAYSPQPSPQPVLVKRSVDKSHPLTSPSTQKLWTYEEYAKQGSKAMVSAKSLVWRDNSCWIDAAFMALFSLPESSLTKAIANATKIITYQDQLEFSDSTRIGISCDDEDAKQTHGAILSDLEYIQNPNPSQERLCATKPFWKRRCVENPATSDVAELDVVDVITMLNKFYSLSTNNLLNITTPPNQEQVDSTYTYVVQDLVSVIGDISRFFDKGELKPTPPRVKYTNSRTHQIAAIVYTIYHQTDTGFVSGHYISHIRDLRANEWHKFDKGPTTTVWTKLSTADVTAQNEYVSIYQEASKNRENVTYYRVPRILVYVRTNEFKRLVDLRTAADSKIPVAPAAPSAPAPAAGSGSGSAAPAPQPQPGPTTEWTPIKVAELATKLTKPGIGSAPLNPELQKIADWLGLQKNTVGWSTLDGAKDMIYIGHLDAQRLAAFERAYDAAKILSDASTTSTDYPRKKVECEEEIARNMMQADINDYGSVERITKQYAFQMAKLEITSLPANKQDYNLVTGLLEFIATSGSSFGSNPDPLILDEETARVAMQVDLENYK